VLSLVASSEKEGAKVIADGRNAKVADAPRGFYLGATIVDPVNYPPVVLQASSTIMKTIGDSEVREQYETCFAPLEHPRFPKSLAEMITRAEAFTEARSRMKPYPIAYAAFKDRLTGPPSTSLAFVAAKEHGIALVRDTVLDLFARYQLDAIVYATRPIRPDLIDPNAATARPSPSPTPQSLRNIGNITQLPDLIVSAGATSDRLPISISFIGPAFSEPHLLAYAYAYEQATNRRILPSTTPTLPGEKFEY